jgi:hypothetical protein
MNLVAIHRAVEDELAGRGTRRAQQQDFGASSVYRDW